MNVALYELPFYYNFNTWMKVQTSRSWKSSRIVLKSQGLNHKWLFCLLAAKNWTFLICFLKLTLICFSTVCSSSCAVLMCRHVLILHVARGEYFIVQPSYLLFRGSQPSFLWFFSLLFSLIHVLGSKALSWQCWCPKGRLGCCLVCGWSWGLNRQQSPVCWCLMLERMVNFKKKKELMGCQHNSVIFKNLRKHRSV